VSISVKNNDLYYNSAEFGQQEKMFFQDPNTFFLSSNASRTFRLYGQQKIDSINATFSGTKLTLIPDNNQSKAYTPNADWKYLQKPSLLGWNEAGLEALRNFLIDSTSISGYMIIHKGRVAFSYGDVSENSYIASCRKSVLAMLMGKYVKAGEINLNKSLHEMGINDINPLTSKEKEATVKDIISARSGVFIEASYGGDNFSEAPVRGAKKAGTYWLYNNWDFNSRKNPATVFMMKWRHNWLYPCKCKTSKENYNPRTLVILINQFTRLILWCSQRGIWQELVN
jgi:hypothetical protein